MGGLFRLGAAAPLPVNQIGQKLRTVRTRFAPSRRPVTRSVLRLPVVVNAPAPPAFVASPLAVQFAPAPRAFTQSLLGRPVVVGDRPYIFPPQIVQLAPKPRASTRSLLKPPVVVDAAVVQPFIAQPVTVQLARSRRGVARPFYVYPIVVFETEALGGILIVLAPYRRRRR